MIQWHLVILVDLVEVEASGDLSLISSMSNRENRCVIDHRARLLNVQASLDFNRRVRILNLKPGRASGRKNLNVA